MAIQNPYDIIDARLQDIEDTLQKLVSKPEPELPPAEKYLTVEQLCELLNVSRVTLWNWEKSGILKSFRIGNLKRFKLSEIEALAEKREGDHVSTE